MPARGETNSRIKALLIAGTGLLLVMAGGARAAESISVIQGGDHSYIHVRQSENGIMVIERQIGDHRYERLSARLPVRIERLVERYLAHEARRLAKGRPTCSSIAANMAGLQQTGSQDQAIIVQKGGGNTAATVQSGSGNVAYTVQLGSGFDADTLQTGDGNIAFIVQRCR